MASLKYAKPEIFLHIPPTSKVGLIPSKKGKTKRLTSSSYWKGGNPRPSPLPCFHIQKDKFILFSNLASAFALPQQEGDLYGRVGGWS